MDLSFSETFKKFNGSWHPVILKLTTDSGIVGLGEAGLAYGVGHNGAVGMLQDFVKAFVLGKNPLDREVIWNNMQRHSFWGGASGPVICATMSAIDIALWDITGKYLNQPIWQLLGGRIQRNLRSYASQIQFGWFESGGWEHLNQPSQYADAALHAVEQGYDAIKVDPVIVGEEGKLENPHKLKGALPKTIINRATSRIAEIRNAVGPDIDIILELHSLTSLTGGQQLAQACAEFGIFMVEEAVNYNSDRPARRLKERMPNTRMTGGERIFTRWQFQAYLEDGSFDMIQPDFCLVGGISEGKKICDMAHSYEVTVQGHVCGSPISSIAAAHIESAIPNFQIHEHHVNATCPANRDICVQDYQPEQGRLIAPMEPGLGLELNEEYVRANGASLLVNDD